MTNQSSTVARHLLCTLLCVISGSGFAQGIPDARNINIIGVNPPTAADGVPDPGLKQQNEPSCAKHPANPLKLLCAFNDYRGVDNPLIGDAWEGYAYSINGGQTWFSDLLPGHPGDSPNIGFQFAADPQVVAAPGLAMISYIAADRGEDAEGGLFLQRMFEVNREAGAPWSPDTAPIEVARGNADSFIDKPFMLLHPAPAGSPTLTISSVLRDGTPVIQEVPAARILLAYTVFSGTAEGGDLMSKIIVAVSDDYGESWTTRVLANSSCQLPGQGHCKDKGNGHRKGKGKGHSKRRDVIQSASIAAHGDNVCAVWRRFEDADQLDAVMVACSDDRGETFALPAELSVVPAFSPLDQGTTEITFRTNSYPVITSDGSKFYAFWATRDVTHTPFFARIVYSSSEDGAVWTLPVMLDDAVNGHQFMPTAAAAGGTIRVAWLDTRNNLFQADFIQDLRGENGVPDEDSTKIIRNKADVRTLEIVDGAVSPSVQVSRYLEGAIEVDGPVQQLEFNFINDRLFKQGTVPFAGDYPAIAAPTFRLENGQWVSNAGLANTERPVDFLIAWSDNRDVRGNVWNDLVQPTLYTPADLTAESSADAGRAPLQDAIADDTADAMMASNATQEAQGSERAEAVADGSADKVRADAEPDPTDSYGVCQPGTNLDRSRNQNVYSTIVRPGVSIDSPSSSKPTGAIQRAHVVWVSNNENTAATYRLTINNQPPDAGPNGRASFLQVPVAPFPSGNAGLLTEIDVAIDANSTVARTVYVTSQTPEPQIAVSVSDGASTVFGTVTLNGDVLSPDIQNPDIQNPDVQNPDIQNAEVHNPDVQNVVITRVKNPDVQNPDVQNPDIQNPDVQNPDVQNPDIQNPDIQNPDIQNTSLEGSSADNPDVANDFDPSDTADGYTDITQAVTNNGNTTTAFNLDTFVTGDTTGLKTQLIGTRTHVTETSLDCVQSKLVQNQVIFNKLNPDLSLFTGNSNDGVFFGDGSAYIAPGETIYVTLRVWGDPDLFDAERAGVRVVSQSCNTADKGAGTIDCDPPADQTFPTLADIDFDLVPPLQAGFRPDGPEVPKGSEIDPLNNELEKFGVRWEQSLGNVYLSAEQFLAWAQVASPFLAFDSLSLYPQGTAPEGTHTLKFICPDGSGRPATVTTATVTVQDDDEDSDKRMLVRSFDADGTLLESKPLASGDSIDTFTFVSGVNPIAKLIFTDTLYDGHILDDLSYEGLECSSTSTAFNETVITGDASILNTGTLIVANNMNYNTSAVTVNGVSFGTDQGGFTTFSGTGGVSEWNPSVGDFSIDAFSPALDAILSANRFIPHGYAEGELEIPGLIAGNTYRLQLLFSNDEDDNSVNTTSNHIRVTIEGQSWDLDNWQAPRIEDSDAINLIFSFTATSSSVVVEFAPLAQIGTSESGRAILNGYALHEVPVIP